MAAWRNRRRLIGAVAAILTAVSPPIVAQERGIIVFAAASLAGALDDVAAAFTAATGAPVTVSYAATSALARQIEQGAPADIFISADIAWMDYLAERSLITTANRIDLLGNRLVLIAPAATAAADADIGATLTRELGPGRLLAMANVDAVPAGRYGKAVLQALGLWSAVQPYVAQTDNVRSALAFVARGECPLGIVYATDAAIEPTVTIVAAFDESLHPPIVYPAALVAGVDDPAAAFLAFLSGPEAAAIFIGYGFTIPDRRRP